MGDSTIDQMILESSPSSFLDTMRLLQNAIPLIRSIRDDVPLQKLEEWYKILRETTAAMAPVTVSLCEMTAHDEDIHQGVVSLFELLDMMARKERLAIYDKDPELVMIYWFSRDDLRTNDKCVQLVEHPNPRRLELFDNLNRLGICKNIAMDAALDVRDVHISSSMKSTIKVAHKIVAEYVWSCVDPDANHVREFWDDKLQHVLAPEVRKCVVDESFSDKASDGTRNGLVILSVYLALMKEIYKAGKWDEKLDE